MKPSPVRMLARSLLLAAGCSLAACEPASPAPDAARPTDSGIAGDAGSAPDANTAGDASSDAPHGTDAARTDTPMLDDVLAPADASTGADHTSADTGAAADAAADPDAASQDGAIVGAPLGPSGGGLYTRVVVSPQDPAVLWAGNDMGGVFKSADRGATWSYLSTRFHGAGVHDIAIDPSDPDRVYVQSEIGVERSDDGGLTWTLLTALHLFQHTPSRPQVLNHYAYLEGARRLEVLTVDPHDPQTLYTGGFCCGDSDTQIDHQKYYLYRSRDQGASWETVPADAEYQHPAGSYFTGVLRAIRVHPQSADTLIVAGYRGVYRSANAGASWERISNGLPDEPLPMDLSRAQFDAGLPFDTYVGPDVRDLAIHPTQPLTMYVLTRTHGVYKTVDGGAHWDPANGPADDAALALELSPYEGVFDGARHMASMETLILDPADPEHLLVALEANKFLSESLDGGQTWREILHMWPAERPAEVGADFPYDAAQRTFHACARGDCGGPKIDLVLSPDEPGTIYGAADMGLERLRWSPGTGALTERTFLYRGLYTITPYSRAPTVFSFDHGQTLYLGGMDTSLMKSSDGGQSWRSLFRQELLFQGETRTWVHVSSLQFVETVPRTIFMSSTLSATGGGVFRSRDDGQSWTRLIDGLPVDSAGGGGLCSQVLLAPDFATSQTVYAVCSFAGGGVFKSVDQGDHWSRISVGLPADTLHCDQCLAVDPDDPTLLYLTPIWDGARFYRSEDGGATWQQPSAYEDIGDPLGGPTVVPTSSGKKLFVAGQVGVVVSTDRGQSWTRSFYLLDRIDPAHNREPWVLQMPLTKVVFHPAAPDKLFFLTSNWGSHARLDEGGIFASADGGSSWERIASLPNFGGCLNVSDDGAALLQFSGGMAVWRYALPAAWRP